MPIPLAVSLHKLGPSLRWFVQDYKKHTLDVLADVGTHFGLGHDFSLLHSDLSHVEYGRIQRAFCHFEVFRYLFRAPKDAEIDMYLLCATAQYLGELLIDEVEEIGCIRDYMIRRLCGVFEQIEADALKEHEEQPDGPFRKLGRDCARSDWFSGGAKSMHIKYMEYIMSLGLPFLQEIFQSDGLKRASHVISNTSWRKRYLTSAICDWTTYESELDDFDDECEYSFDGTARYLGEYFDAYPKGYLWANRGRVPTQYKRSCMSGFRTWGYVFWSDDRLQASGVLSKDPKEIARYKFSEKDFSRRLSVQEKLSSKPSLPLLQHTQQEDRSGDVPQD
ncbi:MAG: hypothetical protein LQ350_006781 [Teloschistes chrysophthalmus]|nr:MAG: hypothetical protein LQ350_006781 [Niorma chrysophthalma]